jgi:hypothetical protein
VASQIDVVAERTRVRATFGDADYHDRVGVSAVLGRRGDERLEA